MRARGFAQAALMSMVAALLIPVVPFAQGKSLRQRLADAKAVVCEFPVVATGTWDDDGARLTAGPATRSVSFTNIDTREGTADVSNPFGDALIVVRYVGEYLHLMEMKGEGPLYTTTVLAQPGRNGRLRAVHTRVEYTLVTLPGYTSRPEIYVGDCAVE